MNTCIPNSSLDKLQQKVHLSQHFYISLVTFSSSCWVSGFAVLSGVRPSMLSGVRTSMFLGVRLSGPPCCHVSGPPCCQVPGPICCQVSGVSCCQVSGPPCCRLFAYLSPIWKRALCRHLDREGRAAGGWQGHFKGARNVK